MRTERETVTRARDLVRLLESRTCRIFGIGFVSDQLWYGLAAHGLTAGVRGFVVSRCAEGTRRHGLPVTALAETVIPPEEPVLLAVHDAVAREVVPDLRRKGAWILTIYPCLTELCYGEALATGQTRSVRDLLAAQGPDDLWLALRYAAVRDILGGGDEDTLSADLYRRAMALHSSPAAAQSRLLALGDLAVSMKEQGWKAEHAVLIDSRDRIIDGLHRLACAACLGMGEITTVTYPASEIYDQLLGDRNRLPVSYLLDRGFTQEEVAFLRQAQREMIQKETGDRV